MKHFTWDSSELLIFNSIILNYVQCTMFCRYCQHRNVNFIVSLLCLHCILSLCSVPLCLHCSHRISVLLTMSCQHRVYVVYRLYNFLFTSLTSSTSWCWQYRFTLSTLYRCCEPSLYFCVYIVHIVYIGMLTISCRHRVYIVYI